MNQLKNGLGKITDEAIRGPVVLTHYKRDRFVLVSMEEWDRRTGADPRRVYRTDELPAEDVENILREGQKFLDGDDT